MDQTTILGLVKARLGISSTVRDTYLTAIIGGVLTELQDEKGLSLDGDNLNHLIFVVDYVTWRYQGRDSTDAMPRHLQFRLHNLIIHVGSANIRVDDLAWETTYPLNPSTYTVYILPDGTKNMYLNDAWTEVNMTNGVWAVVAT